MSFNKLSKEDRPNTVWLTILSYFWLQSSSSSLREIPSSISLPPVSKFHMLIPCAVGTAITWHKPCREASSYFLVPALGESSASPWHWQRQLSPASSTTYSYWKLLSRGNKMLAQGQLRNHWVRRVQLLWGWSCASSLFQRRTAAVCTTSALTLHGTLRSRPSQVNMVPSLLNNLAGMIQQRISTWRDEPVIFT